MKKTALLLALAFALTACGGGGGSSASTTATSGSNGNSSSTGGGNTAPVDTSSWPVYVTPTPYVESYIAGLAPSINLDVMPKTFLTTTPTVVINDSNGILVGGTVKVNEVINSSGQVTGHYSVSLPVNTLAAGHYTGSFTVNICVDTACKNPLSGSPFQYPYDITVTSGNVSALSGLNGAGDWNNFQGNAAHTGYVPVTLDASQFSSRWMLPLQQLPGAGGYNTDLTTSNGLLYLASNNHVYALSEASGSVAWSASPVSCTNCFYNTPVSSTGKVYVSVNDGSAGSYTAFALSAANGATLFQSAGIVSKDSGNETLTLSGGNLYLPSMTGSTVSGINGSNGATLFTKNLASTSMTTIWTPAVDASSVYTYADGCLYILNNMTGVETNTIKSSACNSTSNIVMEETPMLGVAHSVIVADFFGAGALMDFNTATSTVTWQVSGAYGLGNAYANGQIYTANLNTSEMEVRSETDGSLLWSWTPPIDNDSMRANFIVTNNLVFITTQNSVYAVDLSTHNTVWSYPATGDIALSANGILYIINNAALLNSSSRIIAINLH